VTSYREGTAGCCTLPKWIPSLPKRLLIMMADPPSSAISYENPPRRMRSYSDTAVSAPRHIRKPREVQLMSNRDGLGLSVSVLGDDQICLAQPFLVVLIP
jgi:hypothetical protein